MSPLMWKILGTFVAIVIGVLSQLQVDEEILLTEKSVALAAPRSKVFRFLADMRHYKLVRKHKNKS